MAVDRDVVLMLAAGRGTRMGGPKALMHVNARAWWQIQAERLLSANVPSVWVVSQEVERSIDPRRHGGIELVLADSGLPMFESLIVGLESVMSPTLEGIFVLPVDVPVPDRSVFTTLRASKQVAVPTYESRTGHPVYLPRHWLCQIDWSNLPATQRRLDRLIASDMVPIPVDDSDILVDLDTPADVQRWLKKNEESHR